MYTTRAFAAASAVAPLGETAIRRREVGAHDVRIDVLFCGVCHSDLHTVRDEWRASSPTTYPCVPGHEIVGRVAGLGAAVTKHRVGDVVAVGCLVDSCRECAECRAGLEQFCVAPIYTYNSPDVHTGAVTYGGYSASVVVDEHFVLRVPPNLDPAGTAPLLCAGITTWSPLRHWNVGTGSKVGVIGLGGLGHMGVKLARALGAHVTAFTTSPSKVDDARRLGAQDVVVTRDAAALERHTGGFDLLLDTVSAAHDVDAYLALLRRDGTLVLVGAPEHPLPIAAFSLIGGRRRFAGSTIGGIAETQEMLDFCGRHGITADVEVIPVQRVNDAYERLLRSDVKYRFVLDLASLASAP